MLKDFCDGHVLNSHRLFSIHRNGLQILLYFDDIEVVNNLGSHQKVLKLGKLKNVVWSDNIILILHVYRILHTRKSQTQISFTIFKHLFVGFLQEKADYFVFDVYCSSTHR